MYELNRLEKWVAHPSAVADDDAQWEEEASRIRQAFIAMALSAKKESVLRRYFRLHLDGLAAMERRLKTPRPAKAAKQLLRVCQSLEMYIKDHFSQYLPREGEELDPDDPDIDSRKVITTFSVPELGVIIRLFIETGAFRVRNRKALTRFMARNVGIRSKQVPGTFSEDHLYNAIHTPDKQAMDRLQELLNQMLVKLNKLRRDQRNKGR